MKYLPIILKQILKNQLEIMSYLDGQMMHKEARKSLRKEQDNTLTLLTEFEDYMERKESGKI